MNSRKLFNQGWSFVKTSLAVDSPAELTFESVELPHDWLIYNTEDLYEHSIGWYKKTFELNHEVDHVSLQFDGVYMDSSLYINGQFVGEWKYGYSAFEHEITDQLVDGENEILLKVVYQSPNSRWYTGAGIYRNVWLKTYGKNYIESDGIYISTKELDSQWQVAVETELQLDEAVSLKHELFDQNKKNTASVAEVYKSQIDADFGLYKSTRDTFDSVTAKQNADAFALYKSQRDADDALAARISALETKQAVNDAIDPWRAKVLDMKINGVAGASQAAVALEAERRCCADSKIVNYVNSNFYPISVADVTVGTTATPRETFNPLCSCCNNC